jgi:hypothetical protein
MYKLYDNDHNFIMESETFRRKTFSGMAICVKTRTKYWIRDGLVHKDEILGPAIEYPNGSKIWCKEGERHRLDGPAYMHHNGSGYWYFQDKEHTRQEHELLVSLMRLKGLL